MKKTFKLLIIFMGSILAIIIGGLSGYFIISKNKTFYIYDVRFVEPIEGRAGYIYSVIPPKNAVKDDDLQNSEQGNNDNNKENEYKSIKNQTAFMKSQASNTFPIAVYVSSSIQAKEVEITSSDKDIAKIVYQDNRCFVQFLKEGLVTITSEFYGVKDSFTIQIYDQMPSNFLVYDDAYYGEYANLFPNKLISYADDVEYRYDYLLNNVSNTGSNENVDGDLIRIDEENLNTEVFSEVRIDSETNELVVKCKKPETLQRDNIDSTIILQSFYYSADNEIVIENSYEVKVHVVRYIPEFLQVEISSTPDFEEKIVFTDTNTKINDISSIITDAMKENPDLITEEIEDDIDSCLAAEKAETYLLANGEKSTYKAFFTDRIERLYIRLRMVYTNGDIVYLENGENATVLINGVETSDLCKKDPTGDYFIMTLNDSNYFDVVGKKFVIDVSVDGFAKNHEFEFEYKTQADVNREVFYELKDGIYTFTYWDERAKFDNEIYNKEGQVVGFGA